MFAEIKIYFSDTLKHLRKVLHALLKIIALKIILMDHDGCDFFRGVALGIEKLYEHFLPA